MIEASRRFEETEQKGSHVRRLAGWSFWSSPTNAFVLAPLHRCVSRWKACVASSEGRWLPRQNRSSSNRNSEVCWLLIEPANDTRAKASRSSGTSWTALNARTVYVRLCGRAGGESSLLAEDTAATMTIVRAVSVAATLWYMGVLCQLGDDSYLY